jgi:acyl transferase domain-containing protein
MAPHRISNAEDETHDKDVLDPIAIVGYSSLLPGDAVDAPSFWKLMMERRVAMTNIPESRMSLSSWHHADRGRRGQVSAY